MIFPTKWCLASLLFIFVVLVTFFARLYHLRRLRDSRNELLVTIDRKEMYNFDAEAADSLEYPKFMYHSEEDPPEYVDVARASPLPSYDELVYHDQLTRSLRHLA
ncbi:hypothetical protein Q1695_003568 [Nippostrongylus brasiliensis]|nr:hypothetical protein Q1695_003568 [Nippostrongylus brasiliensis]